MSLLSGQQLVEILRRTLNYIDSRLVGHGTHVSVVMYYTLKLAQGLTKNQRTQAYLLGLLHDIGAYKTDEITQMLTFDSSGSWDHCIYGYLFLKKMSSIGDGAVPILYHHLPYSSYTHIVPPMTQQDLSGLIFLADRVDVISREQDANACKAWIIKNSGTLFSPYWVKLFLQAEEQFHLISLIQTENCESGWNSLVKEISLSQEDLFGYLSLIAYTIDFRSEHMVLHTVNTVAISDVMGTYLNLSDKDLRDLHYGALLHDIGKVACPVEILEKPGRLTAEEMEIMRQHVTISREILTGLIDPTVLEIACRHHERIDGSGYPQQLRYDSLTLPERIVAVADVVSALIRKRSYKDAFDKETTLSILKQLKVNHQFCQETVDTVLNNFDAMIQVSDTMGAAMIDAYDSIHSEYTTLMAKLSALSPITVAAPL